MASGDQAQIGEPNTVQEPAADDCVADDPRQRLIEGLLRAAAQLSSITEKSCDEEEGISASGLALSSVSFALLRTIEFLEADDELKSSGLLKPLFTLHYAVLDRLHGGKPPLIFDSPKLEPKLTSKLRKQTKPTNLSREFTYGRLAGAMIVLRNSGMRPGDAAQWLAHEAEKLSIRHPNRTQISGAQIVRWRETIMDHTAPSLRSEAADIVQRRWGAPMSEKAAKKAAMEVLVSISQT